MKAILSQGASGDLKHRAVKSAAYAYLSRQASSCRKRVQAAWPINAQSDPDDEDGNPQGHLLLVHRLQKVDPEDPWLQREWGRVRTFPFRLSLPRSADE